ncbi:MAG: AAA family ATPase [Bacteroidales bacterium]|nr:AAA family ATPase [Bacteroidales bacterium]
MINRYYNIENELDTSVFLFGARQTGKSTFLRQRFPDTPYIDLLDSELRKKYQRRPVLLYEQFSKMPEDTLIIIDEIPEVPELLNEVHRLISQRNLRFILCGSSARKLKRKGHNTLGGRALPCYFYPFVSAELPDLNLDKAVNDGMIPSHYLARDARRRLSAYIDIYLKEEIKEEALVRNLDGFQRFMEAAALTDGEMVNYTNIASDCGVSAVTVKEYFNILEDTLVGYMIPAYTKTIKRKLMQAPRFYFFDVGIANHLLNRHDLTRGTAEYGHAFEHLVIQELVAYIGYTHNSHKISYWHTYTGLEVDAVIGDAELAIEIKSAEEIMPKHLKGLRAFHEEHPDARLMVVSLDRITRNSDGVEIVYVRDFFAMLWKGELF